ncbi:hypothetical protein LXL04_034683 [Taraxacum kok-saghyz]
MADSIITTEAPTNSSQVNHPPLWVIYNKVERRQFIKGLRTWSGGEVEGRDMLVQVRTIIKFENGGTNLDRYKSHHVDYKASDFSDFMEGILGQFHYGRNGRKKEHDLELKSRTFWKEKT